MQTRPEKNEYASYYQTYVNLVPEGELTIILSQQVEETLSLVKDISDAQALFKYASEKWSIKEVVGHIADTERIMGYRLLAIARGETVSLPGYNDNQYVTNALFDKQSINDLLQNLVVVRQSTLHLIKNLTDEALVRRGLANNSEVTVRALATIIAGHELHHRQIIKDRYIGAKEYPNS
ncbi:DinB family protein [Metabacillus herbersteinensis]|uniref:DinB family protein n=1 Tax=Metabacillus herbersteinensis TaxID=283816 RepID=A0ABV6GAR8_9BACI